MSFIAKLFNAPIPLDFRGMTDWHSHVLPGVDDGATTLDDSLAILKGYEELGIDEVWLTPHIMEDMPNSVEKLRRAFLELETAFQGKIKLHLAAENMIDTLFAKRLASGELLPIGPGGKTLLVETSYFNPPMGFVKTIEGIKSNGYTPLVAHPERYAYVESFDEYESWKDMGCAFQLNLLSLGGYYGVRAEKISRLMLKKEMYDYVGTDIHKPVQLEAMKKLRLPKELVEGIERLFEKNKY